MTGVDGLTVSVKVAVPVPPVLVALKLTETVPEEAGVPEIRPDVVLMLRPVGKPVAL